MRLLDHLKIKEAHVRRLPMGAWITLKLVATHPERVKTATLGGNAGLHPSQAARQQIIADAIEGKDIAAGVMELDTPQWQQAFGGRSKGNRASPAGCWETVRHRSRSQGGRSDDAGASPSWWSPMRN